MRILLLLALLLGLAASARAQESTALDVYSDPPGATVFLDRHGLGRTPLRITPIGPGEHLLRVSAGPDYKPFQQTVQVPPGQVLRVDARLEPSTARLLRDGKAAFRAGRVEEALAALDGALQGRPRQPEAFWWVGRLKLDRGDLEGALAAFRGYADFHPEHPQLYLYLGLVHERREDFAGAVTAYKLALLSTPGLAGALAAPPASTWGNIRVAGHPTDPAGQMRLAWMYEQKGRFPEALRWLHSAVRATFGDWMKTAAPAPARGD